MKKEVYLLISFISIATLSIGQKLSYPTTNWGIKAGQNTSSVNFTPTVDQKINPGFVGGLSFKHLEQKNLGIQIELNYLQAGWNEDLDSNQHYSRQLNYLQIPFLSHLNFGNNSAMAFLNIGPYFSYLLSEKESIEDLKEGNEEAYYGTKTTNNIDVGLSLGLGFFKNTSVGVFQIEGRGNLGLNNIYSETSEFSFGSSKNINAELTLSYFIDFSTF